MVSTLVSLERVVHGQFFVPAIPSVFIKLSPAVELNFDHYIHFFYQGNCLIPWANIILILYFCSSEPVHVHGTKDNSAILDLDVKNIQIKSSIAPHQGAGRPALYAKHDPAPASSKTASNISQPPTPSASLEALPPLPVPHNSSGGTEAGRGSLSTNGGGTHKLSSAIPSSCIQATSETHKVILFFSLSFGSFCLHICVFNIATISLAFLFW